MKNIFTTDFWLGKNSIFGQTLKTISDSGAEFDFKFFKIGGRGKQDQITMMAIGVVGLYFLTKD